MEGRPMIETLDEKPDPGACCNLNGLEVKRRQKLSVLSFFTAFAAVFLSKLYQPLSWLGLLSAVPFFIGYLGLLQAKARTCVLLAFQEIDLSRAKPQPIPDRATGWLLKKRSIKIIINAGCLAILSTALCWKL